VVDQEPDDKKKIVDLAEARKRQRTLRFGASARQHANGKGPAKPPQRGTGRKIWSYVQFLLFLAVIAYFMRLCQSGGF